MQINDLK